MKSALMPVSALLLGVSLLMAGQGLQGTLLPVRASLEAFSALSIGLIGGTYFLGFTLGCLKGGALVARVGHVRVFAAMTALASSMPLLHGLLVDPLLWSAFRLLTGFCFAVLYVVIESWLNELSTNENRGIVFSAYTVISLTVLAVGQLLMLADDSTSLFLFALTSVLVSIAVLPIVLSTAPVPSQQHAVSVELRRLFRISPAGLLACLGTGLTNGSFWSLAPVFVIGITGDASHAALFMSANVLGGAMCQWPIGYLSDRHGRRSMSVATALAAAVIAVILSHYAASLTLPGLLLLGAAWGAMAFPQYPLAVANTNDHAEPGEYVMVSSGLLLVYGVGAIIGPILASAVMTVLGGHGLYVYTSVIHLLVVLYIVFRVTQRVAVPEAQLVNFQESLVAAVTTSQVYEEEAELQRSTDPA